MKKAKAFGVTSAQRMTLPALASVPTLAESGLPGFEWTKTFKDAGIQAE